MRIRAYLMAIPCLGLCLLPLAGAAQGLKFQLSFTGTCVSNGANGRFVTTPITSRDWLRDYARTHGVSDLSTIGLVYHLAESELGDTIEVVDAASGAVLDRPFLLYFGQSADLGRAALTNNSGNQVAILQYVYTPQNGHSMGSVLLNERLALNTNGIVVNAAIQGRMQYVYLADSTHNFQLCNGTLTTGRRVTFPNQ